MKFLGTFCKGMVVSLLMLLLPTANVQSMVKKKAAQKKAVIIKKKPAVKTIKKARGPIKKKVIKPQKKTAKKGPIKIVKKLAKKPVKKVIKVAKKPAGKKAPVKKVATKKTVPPSRPASPITRSITPIIQPIPDEPVTPAPMHTEPVKSSRPAHPVTRSAMPIIRPVPDEPVTQMPMRTQPVRSAPAPTRPPQQPAKHHIPTAPKLISKPTRPHISKSPTSKISQIPPQQQRQFNRLMIFLDATKVESSILSISGALTQEFVIAMRDCASAVLATRSVIYNYLLAARVGVSADEKTAEFKIASDFFTTNWGMQWDKYYAEEGDLVLLIPKNSPLLSAAFRLDTLKKIDPASDTRELYSGNTKFSLQGTYANLQAELSSTQDNDARLKSKNKFVGMWMQAVGIALNPAKPTAVINSIKTMLIRTQEPSNNTPAWLVYAVGHGSSALTQSRYGPTQQEPPYSAQPSSANILGLPFNNAVQLLSIFNNSINADSYINTALFCVTTCYIGGYNQAFVNAALDRINPQYMVVTRGVTDRPSIAAPDDTANFRKFFDGLEAYFNYHPRPGQSAPTLGMALKNIAHSDISLPPDMPSAGLITSTQIINQAYVRIPNVGTFQAFSVDKQVKNLTKAQVKSYALVNQQKAIDLSGYNAVTIAASWIYNPLLIGQATALISLLTPPIQKGNDKLFSIRPESYTLQVAPTGVPTHFFNEIRLKTIRYFDKTTPQEELEKRLFQALHVFLAQLMNYHSVYKKGYLIKKLSIVDFHNIGTITNAGIINNLSMVAYAASSAREGSLIIAFSHNNKNFIKSITLPRSTSTSQLGNPSYNNLETFSDPTSYETSSDSATLNNQFNNQVTALQQALEKAGEPTTIKPLTFKKSK